MREALNNFKPNVVILSSVIQYLKEPYVWLEKINNLEIDYIIIDRTALVDLDRDILTVQNVPKEIYEASYPSWFLLEEKILEKLKNYSLISDFDGTIETKILLNNSINAYWKGYILKKK
jgi:putative methyltransferase (TIGR04325 family)